MSAEAASAAAGIQAASAHLQAGRLQDAEIACKAILQRIPEQPDALYLLGLIAFQVGMLDEAALFFEHVIAVSPKPADAHNNLGVVLMAQGKVSEAAASYRKAVALLPRHANAHYNLGNALQDLGDLSAAIASYQRAVALTPDHAKLHNNLGDALQASGRLVEAEQSYRRALRVDPGLADVQHNLGDVLQALGRYDDAAACYRRAITLRPDFAEALNNLGNVVRKRGELDAALQYYEQAITAQPAYPEAHHNLADLLQVQGRSAEAVKTFERAIELRPGVAAMHASLAKALLDMGRTDAAIAAGRHAVRLDPEYAEAYHNLADALRECGRLDEAAACGRRALQLKPDYVEALNNLGNTLQAQGRLEEAVACYREILDMSTPRARAHANLAYSNLLLTLQYLPTVSAEAAFEEHLRYAERFEAPLKSLWQPHRNSRAPERRLKVGYVSADFYNHAVAFFIEPILAEHDKAGFEIFCYYNHRKHDDHTVRLMAYADHWLGCAGLSDEALAERLRDDGIDILVDLSGHTGHNRLTVFARKPAPVQATWIGYVGSTGLSAMDYRITNAEMDPPGLTEQFHTETLVRMPNTGVAYRPEPECPPVNRLPALGGAPFTFASLNNLTKCNAAVLALWARILLAVPGSRLMLGNVGDDIQRETLIARFVAHGVAAARLLLQPRMPIAAYLALHHEIDLALDPFPYPGGTTTMHSLWMGVPVVTLAGEHMVSRCAVPLLTRVDLGDFIAETETAYLERAVALANDLPALDRIRQTLRARMSMPEQEAGAVTRNIEAAFRTMWRDWCAAAP